MKAYHLNSTLSKRLFKILKISTPNSIHFKRFVLLQRRVQQSVRTFVRWKYHWMGPTEREISWDHFRSYVKHGWEDAALATSWFLFFQWPNREFGMDPGFGGSSSKHVGWFWVGFSLGEVFECDLRNEFWCFSYNVVGC